MGTPKVAKPVVAAGVGEEEEGLLSQIWRQLRAEFTATGAEILRDRFRKVFEHSRERLWSDLHEMPIDDKRGLLTRIKRADETFREIRLIHLLCCATDRKDATPDERKKILRELSKLPEDAFQQEMSILEHNVLQQWAQWTVLNTKGAFRYVAAQAKATVPPFTKKIGERVATAAIKFNDDAGTNLPAMRKFADDLKPATGRSALGNFLEGLRKQPDNNAAKKGGRP